MEIAANLDWVAARAACCIERVFGDLRDEVEQDITKRNALLSEGQKANLIGFQLIVKQPVEPRFEVHRNGPGIFERVTFKCNESTIAALNEAGRTMLEAKLTLNDAGECRLVVGADELTHWQFRRRALQDLFFAF